MKVIETEEDALDHAASMWREAKRAERVRMAELESIIQVASRAGMSEHAIVRASGINRLTVRRALGKPRRKIDISTD